jgi:hypothetical protein
MKDGNISIGDNYQVADHESIWRSHPPFQNEDFANQNEVERLSVANRLHAPANFYEPHTFDLLRGRNFRKF